MGFHPHNPLTFVPASGRAGIEYRGGVQELQVVRAGLVPYEEAWARQREIHAEVVGGRAPNTVLLLEHPPVYTAGRRTEAWERPTDGSPVVDVDRGGKITWHGPGQLVGYPIVRLPDAIDVAAYVGRMEGLLIEVCAEFGVPAGRIAGRSGVWLPADESGPDRKIAAIGIRVTQGVTLHGFALNCDADLAWFDRIVPCGISDAGVTSLTRELGRPVTVADALPVVEQHLAGLLAGTPVRV